MDYEYEEPAVQQEEEVEWKAVVTSGWKAKGQEKDNRMEEEEDIPVTLEDAFGQAVLR